MMVCMMKQIFEVVVVFSVVNELWVELVWQCKIVVEFVVVFGIIQYMMGKWFNGFIIFNLIEFFQVVVWFGLSFEEIVC